MKRSLFFLLLLVFCLTLAGCGIPDLPGPIGIPGI